MRSHRHIVMDAGGPTRLGGIIKVDAGLVQSWKREDSIPAPYWPRLVDAGIATLDELAAAAEARKFPDLAAERRGAPQEGAAA